MTQKKKNPHQGHRERMRQRVLLQGIENMPEHEILEFLLYPFIPMKDTNPIAHELIDRFGSLQQVLDTSIVLLCDVKNMTQSAAIYLTTLPKIFKKYNLQKFGEKPILDNTKHTVNYFSALFGNESQESMYMVIVDPQGRLLDRCKIGEGDIDSCKMNIKEFIMRTASSPSDYVIIAHIHPSGNAAPSMKDYNFTSWLISIAEVIGVSVLDHIIIAKDEYFSFRESGQLSNFASTFKKYMQDTQLNDPSSLKINKINRDD